MGGIPEQIFACYKKTQPTNILYSKLNILRYSLVFKHKGICVAGNSNTAASKVGFERRVTPDLMLKELSSLKFDV